jgi:hypothetical protein
MHDLKRALTCEGDKASDGMVVQRALQSVSRRIEKAQIALLDLGNAVARRIRIDDLVEIETASRRVSDVLDNSLRELSDAVCDAEAAMDRF